MRTIKIVENYKKLQCKKRNSWDKRSAKQYFSKFM